MDCHNEEHKFEREKKSITRPGLQFNEKGELIQIVPPKKMFRLETADRIGENKKTQINFYRGGVVSGKIKKHER